MLSGMFLYPRKGWSWDGPQELTLGYGFAPWREIECAFTCLCADVDV